MEQKRKTANIVYFFIDPPIWLIYILAIPLGQNIIANPPEGG